ncbi:MAG: UPF0164 family protein [Spirochaetes bacterium]|nr:UPF0164 family protein [Spirochaetota bacterium]
MAKKLLCFAILFIILVSFSASAFDLSDFYYRKDRLFGSFSDPNTGLTAFPTLLIPMGGRMEAMGTAFTAVADDASFLEANPAGSSSLRYTELVFFHNNWIADTNIESLVFTARHNNFGFALGAKFLYVPFTGYGFWGERTSRGFYSETVGIINASYRFFASHDFWGIALGTNFKIAYRHIPEAIYANQSAFATMMDFGLLTRFNFLKFYHAREKNASFGITLKNLGIAQLDDPLPLEVTAGIAYSPIRPLILAFDFTQPISLDPEIPAEKWGFAVGADLRVTDFFSVQCGFRYRGNNPRFSVGSRIDFNNISFNFNYTLDLTTQAGLDRFSVVASLNLGDRGRGQVATRVDEFYILGLLAYANGDLRAAADYWERAIELDPGFSPAIANLATVKRTLRILDEMMLMQTTN